MSIGSGERRSWGNVGGVETAKGVKSMELEKRYMAGKTASKGGESAIATGVAALLALVVAKRAGLDVETAAPVIAGVMTGVYTAVRNWLKNRRKGRV